MRYLLLLLPLILLSGCADSSTTGNIRHYNIDVAIHNNTGDVYLDFPLQVDAASETSQTTTDQTASATPAIRVQLSEGGLIKSGAAEAVEELLPKPQTP